MFSGRWARKKLVTADRGCATTREEKGRYPVATAAVAGAWQWRVCEAVDSQWGSGAAIFRRNGGIRGRFEQGREWKAEFFRTAPARLFAGHRGSHSLKCSRRLTDLERSNSRIQLTNLLHTLAQFLEILTLKNQRAYGMHNLVS